VERTGHLERVTIDEHRSHRGLTTVRQNGSVMQLRGSFHAMGRAGKVSAKNCAARGRRLSESVVSFPIPASVAVEPPMFLPDKARSLSLKVIMRSLSK